MNKDSWTLVFNKVLDPTFMSLKDLNKKILAFTQEKDKRLHEKYLEFCNSLECTVLKTFFSIYFSTTPHVGKLESDSLDFIFGKPNGSVLRVDLKENR